MNKVFGLSIMKKALSIVLLLSGLFLYGCGASGSKTASSDGSNSTSNPGGGPQPQLGSAQVFTLNLVDADNVRAARATTFPGTESNATATDVRVVMRLFSSVTTTHQECQFTYDEEENVTGVTSCTDVGVAKLVETYKDIQDVPYSASVSVSIPEADGYTIDVITSQLTAGPTHNILKYGHVADVNVGGNNPTTGTISISSVGRQLNMSVADNILSSTPTHTVSFDVTVNNGLPFAPSYSLIMTFGSVTFPGSSSTNKCTIKAPISNASGGEVDVKGTFTLDNAFLNQGDSRTNWIRSFPYLAGERVWYNLSPLVSVTVL